MTAAPRMLAAWWPPRPARPAAAGTDVTRLRLRRLRLADIEVPCDDLDRLSAVVPRLSHGPRRPTAAEFDALPLEGRRRIAAHLLELHSRLRGVDVVALCGPPDPATQIAAADEPAAIDAALARVLATYRATLIAQQDAIAQAARLFP